MELIASHLKKKKIFANKNISQIWNHEILSWDFVGCERLWHTNNAGFGIVLSLFDKFTKCSWTMQSK